MILPASSLLAWIQLNFRPQGPQCVRGVQQHRQTLLQVLLLGFCVLMGLWFGDMPKVSKTFHFLSIHIFFTTYFQSACH